MGAKLNSQPYIFGCGYLGRELGKQLSARNQSPHAFVKSEQSIAKLRKLQIDATILDLDQSNFTIKKFDFTGSDIYYFVPPDRNGSYDQRIDQFLQLCINQAPRRIVYISTSGVYGDCGGDWVNEDRPTAPLTDRAKRRVYAEQALQQYCHDSDTEYMILRVGGIYGAERLPIHRLANIKVICPEEAPFSNRIHVEDLAQVCAAAMECEATNEIVNVADGHPSTMTDYYYQIADLAGHPRPTCVPMSQAENQLSPEMLSFVNESRRLSIEKMQSLLQIQLQFPTLELGLAECFKQLHIKEL